MATVAVTPDQDVITGEIFVAAPPARVFQAITDPKEMPRWWGAAGLYRITEWKADLRVGGKWSSDGVGADGKTFRVEGEYLEIDPPRYWCIPGPTNGASPCRPSSAGNSSRKAFTACIPEARSARVQARWSRFGTKASPAILPRHRITPRAGRGSWDG